MCVPVTKTLLAALIHKGLGDLLQSPFFLGAVTFSNDTRQPGWCVRFVFFVCVCVHVWLCADIVLHIPPQVSVCWCLTGGSQKTLPGRCTWSSTRRTAGEGLPASRRSLLLRLPSFNLSARRATSLVTSSCHVVSSSPFAEQTCTRFHHMCRTQPRAALTQADSHPAWDPRSSCSNCRGGHMCHKRVGSCRQIALLP